MSDSDELSNTPKNNLIFLLYLTMGNLYPRQHSAEHILTGVFGMLFQWSIIDSRFKENKVRCDFRVKLDIPLEEAIKQVENKANEIIYENRPITFENASRNEATHLCTLHRIPENAENIRLVKIGNDIITPCIGEHISNTKEIGTLHIRTFNLTEPDVIRLTFALEDIENN